MYSKMDLKKAALLILFITLFFPSLLMAMDVSLAWEPSADPNVAGYRLYVREEIEDYNYNFPEWEGTETNGIIIGLDQYESYFFVVRAFDHQGNESADSNEVYLPANYDDHQLNSETGGSGGGTISGDGAGGGGCFISNFFSKHRL